MQNINEASFGEVQYFRQIWLWVIIACLAGMFWFGFVEQIIFKVPFGTNPAPDSGLIAAWLFAGVVLPWFFYSVKLITFAKTDGIYFRFVPFHFSYCRIAYSDIFKYEIRTYAPIREYGGWGIRYGLHGKAYNVSGNKGIQFELKNGKKILLGTQKPEEFFQSIKEYTH